MNKLSALLLSQCRAARGLVELSQSDQAKKALVGLSTIRNFETEKSIPIVNNLTTIQKALEEAGVEFIDNGVRLRK